jgi:hypothetical protein
MLGDVAARTDRLEVSCPACDRWGMLSIARLLAEHGPADSRLSEARRPTELLPGAIPAIAEVVWGWRYYQPAPCRCGEVNGHNHLTLGR